LSNEGLNFTFLEDGDWDEVIESVVVSVVMRLRFRLTGLIPQITGRTL
jgi:hypothetical protein